MSEAKPERTTLVDIPANLPEPLKEVLSLSDRLDGECVIFTPEDRIAYANAAYQRHYAFCDFSNATYEDTFWGGIKHGLYDVNELRMNPEDYFTMAKIARRANERLDFIKRYAAGNMLGHHRLADGWSVQVRLPVDSPLWRGGFAGAMPNSLAEAAGAADAVRRIRRALDSLATGMLFIDNAGDVLWANAAADHALTNLKEISLQGGRLIFSNPYVAADFTDALSGVLQGPPDTRKFLALPGGDDGSLVCSMIAQSANEALLLLAPRLEGDAVRGALLGFGLSPAECRVALLAADGHSPQTVAEMTGKSINTIRAQLAAVMKKGRDATPATRTGISALIYRIASVAGAGARRLH